MSKLMHVAKYLIELDSEREGTQGISNLKLQKLMYYIQGFHLALYDKPMFDSQVEAWTHGPVFPELYHSFKNHKSGAISPETVTLAASIEALSQDEIELIQEVYDVYGQFSAWKLRDLTHEEEPWLQNEEEAGVIPQSQLKSFFRTRLN